MAYFEFIQYMGSKEVLTSLQLKSKRIFELYSTSLLNKYLKIYILVFKTYVKENLN